MIFIDSDSYRYLEYYKIHKKKEFSQITKIKIDAIYGIWTPIVISETHRLIHQATRPADIRAINNLDIRACAKFTQCQAWNVFLR